MQLTSFEQCKVGMTVWHPFYGEGKVDEVSIYILYVSFNVNRPDQFGLGFWQEDKGKSFREPYLISHLYTEPVFICEKVEETVTIFAGKPITKTIYQPIKPELK